MRGAMGGRVCACVMGLAVGRSRPPWMGVLRRCAACRVQPHRVLLIRIGWDRLRYGDS